MKTKIAIAVLLALAVLTSFGLLTAAADGPAVVAFLDNQPHQLAANASQLFRFDYAINSDYTRPTTNITLVNGTNSGISFAVWTKDGLTNLTNSADGSNVDTGSIQPVGRGTAQTVDCNSGVVNGSGSCQSADLKWSGTFGSSGTYFVQVMNSNSTQVNYRIMIQGSGVSLQPQTQTASAPVVRIPAAAPSLVTIASDPSKAVAIDGQTHSLPASAVTWYRLDYSINADGTRPTATIRLVNGTNSGVSFEVWTADGLTNLANSASGLDVDKTSIQPIGRGTAATVNCDTGTLNGSGSCQAPDLTWSGTFGSSGTYLVKVINSTNTPMNFMLTIQ